MRRKQVPPRAWLIAVSRNIGRIPWTVALAAHWLQDLLLSLQPVVAVWGLAVLAVGLRRPRPPLAALARRPGFAACCASAVVTLLGSLLTVPTFLYRFGHEPLNLRFLAVSCLRPEQAEAGLAVASAWAVLALAGWRPDRGWIDRLGRLIGWYWILMIPVARLAPENFGPP